MGLDDGEATRAMRLLGVRPEEVIVPGSRLGRLGDGGGGRRGHGAVLSARRAQAVVGIWGAGDVKAGDETVARGALAMQSVRRVDPGRLTCQTRRRGFFPEWR